MRPFQAQPRVVFVAHCVHCKRRHHAPDRDSLAAQLERHLRNCNAFKQFAAKAPVSEPT